MKFEQKQLIACEPVETPRNLGRSCEVVERKEVEYEEQNVNLLNCHSLVSIFGLYFALETQTALSFLLRSILRPHD